MIAVWLGQQRSQAVGSGFECLSCQIFLRFIPNIFRYPKVKRNTKRLPYEIFRHCETKNFRRKILILPPPLLSINFFATGNFLKHSTEGLPYEIFRHSETKNFRRKILILPPPSYSNFFGTRNQCNSKGFPYGNFRHCETKNFRQKIMTLPPSSSPPHSKINFFATGNFLKHSTEGFLYEMFRYCKTKNFRRKIVT